MMLGSYRRLVPYIMLRSYRQNAVGLKLCCWSYIRRGSYMMLGIYRIECWGPT